MEAGDFRTTAPGLYEYFEKVFALKD